MGKWLIVTLSFLLTIASPQVLNMNTVGEILAVFAYYRRNHLGICKGEPPYHLYPVHQRSLEGYLLLYKYKYANLPQLMKDLFAKQELSPAQFDDLGNDLAKLVINHDTCGLAHSASDYFIWPDYFIYDKFNTTDRYLKNMVSYQCALNKFKADFDSYVKAIKDALQVAKVKKLVEDVARVHLGSQGQLLDRIKHVLCQEKALCGWPSNFFMKHTILCYASKYVPGPPRLSKKMAKI